MRATKISNKVEPPAASTCSGSLNRRPLRLSACTWTSRTKAVNNGLRSFDDAIGNETCAHHRLVSTRRRIIERILRLMTTDLIPGQPDGYPARHSPKVTEALPLGSFPQGHDSTLHSDALTGRSLIS